MLILNRLSGFGAKANNTQAVSSLAFVDSDVSSSSSQVTVPAGRQAGDLIILVDFAAGGSGNVPPKVIPSGFTEIASPTNSISGWRVTASYKVSDGTETTLTGQSSSAFKAVWVLRANAAIVSASLGGAQTSGPTNSNPGSINVSASGGAAPLAVFGIYISTDDTVDPRSFTPAKDDEADADGNGLCWLAWRLDLESPQNTSIDMDDEGFANTLFGWYLELAA